MANVRSRCFALILYRDSDIYNYDEVINYITSNFEKYAYIVHKPEKDESKEHTHVLFYFNNKRYLSSLSNELGIPSNYFEEAHLKPYLKYLIHYDNEEKIQYTLQDVHGPLSYLLEELISDKRTEKEDFEMIFDFINEYDGKLSFNTLVKYCLNCNLYSTFRRNVNALRILLNEHNNVY